jgi:hypothetical protein
MIFEILGFLFLAFLLGGFSLQVLIIGMLGGTDISPLPIKQYYWYLPLVSLTIYLWYVLLSASPISVTIN